MAVAAGSSKAPPIRQRRSLSCDKNFCLSGVTKNIPGTPHKQASSPLRKWQSNESIITKTTTPLPPKMPLRDRFGRLLVKPKKPQEPEIIITNASTVRKLLQKIKNRDYKASAGGPPTTNSARSTLRSMLQKIKTEEAEAGKQQKLI